MMEFMGSTQTSPTAPRKAPPLALTMGDAAGIGPECISSRADGRLEVALRATRAPGQTPQRAAVTRFAHGFSTEDRLRLGAELGQGHRLIGLAQEAQVLIPKPLLGLPAKAKPELCVVAQHGVGVQGQVVGQQIDVGADQSGHALAQPAGQAPVMTAPKQAVVDQQGIGA